MKNPTLYIVSFLALFYFVGAGLLAVHAPITHDEFFTLHLSLLPNLGTLWQALRETIDFHPPLHFALTRYPLLGLGISPLSLRLISLLSGFVFLLGIFSILKRKLPLPYALMGALIPMATHPYHYFFTARSYMLMLALVTWGTYFWLQGRQEKRLTGSHLAMAFCFFLASSAHYYAVLAFAAPLGAEAFLILKRRKIYWPTLTALTLSALASFFFLLPFAIAAREFSGTFWGHAGLRSLWETYNFFLGEKTAILWMALLLIFFLPLPFRRRSPSPTQTVNTQWETDEILCFSILALMPFIAVTLSALTHAGFTHRYVLITISGLSILIATLTHWRLQNRPLRIQWGLTTMLIWTALLWTKDYQWMSEQKGLIIRDVNELLAYGSKREPIVIGQYDIFMQYQFYAPREERNRIVFINSKRFAKLYTDNKDCSFASEALLDFSKVAVNPKDFLKDQTDFPCLLSQLDRETPALLHVTHKTPLNWRVGDYQLYRCYSTPSAETQLSLQP